MFVKEKIYDPVNVEFRARDGFPRFERTCKKDKILRARSARKRFPSSKEIRFSLSSQRGIGNCVIGKRVMV